MNENLKEKIEEKLFKQKVLQVVIFSQIAIKPIIKKFDNKQELSKRDYKLLNKFKDKNEELLKEDMPLKFRNPNLINYDIRYDDLKFRERGSLAMLYRDEASVLYAGFIFPAFLGGVLGGSIWGDYKKEQFLNNTANGDFINNAMQLTNSHNMEQLTDYLSINRDNPSLVSIYDHLSEVIQQADKIQNVSDINFCIAAVSIGVLIPTCIIGYIGVTRMVRDFVNTVNYDIRNMCNNADKVNEKILPKKQDKAKEPTQTK